MSAWGIRSRSTSCRRAFPLRFSLADDDAVLVYADHTQTIPIGSPILSIDGISARAYRDVVLAAFGAQTRTLHRSRFRTSGAWASIAVFGTGPTYRVLWRTERGVRRQTDVVVPTSPSTFFSTAFGAPGDEPYAYRTLRSGAIGYIDYRRCEDLPRFERFLKETFAAIRRKPVRAVVIDLRSNGGGDSALNDVLWPYVSAKPFKQFGGVIEKACDRIKSAYGRQKYVETYGNAAWHARDGTTTRSGSDLIVPAKLVARYTGPVYLLISSQTFSSAMSCALAAKDYGLATIVGEETGEPVTSTGEVFTLTTPGLGLQAYLTTKVFLPPKPHALDEGVVPDIIVPTTLADRAAGRDPVLERVVRELAI